MRGDITARAGAVTVSHLSTASKPHVCGSCGGPIGEGDRYMREETVNAKTLHLQDGDPDFWRRWGRVPHSSKEIGVFHETDQECEAWLVANSEPAIVPQVETLSLDISDRWYPR